MGAHKILCLCAFFRANPNQQDSLNLTKRKPAMAFDYKKEYKEFYLPKAKPSVVELPLMRYIAISGSGNPNEAEGDYQRAIQQLFTVAYTLKMSYKTDYRIEGFFDYVVPPLEGLWWLGNADGSDFTDKSAYRWTSMIRVPDFIQQKDVDWAKLEAARKKGMDCSGVKLMDLEEGLCAQIMHIGPYDAEPESLALLDRFIESNGYTKDLTSVRRHHELYLSDPRRCSPDKLKTVLRIPIAAK